jgi:hypothetical protein
MQYKELLRHELTREMKTDTLSQTLNIVIFKDHYIKCNSLWEFDRSHPVVLYQYNSILVYKHNNFYHRMTVISV